MDQDDAEKEKEWYLCHDDNNEFPLKFNFLEMLSPEVPDCNWLNWEPEPELHKYL